MLSFLRHHTLEIYNIGFIEKPLDSVITDGIGTGDVQWMQHDYRDRFFADPFLIKRTSDRLYVLCEEFIFWEGRGKITMLEVSVPDYRLEGKKTLIEEPFHLSFPNCEENGHTVIAEAADSGACFVYEIDVNNWAVISRRKITDAAVVDAVFYPSVNHRDWMICTKTNKNDYLVAQSDSYICQNQGGFFNKASMIPYVKSLRYSRSGGRFFHWRGRILRPVQDNAPRYGKQIVILDYGANPRFDRGYSASELTVLNSAKNPPFNMTFHTFNVYPNLIVVDGSADFKFYFRRNVYKHCSRLCRWFYRS